MHCSTTRHVSTALLLSLLLLLICAGLSAQRFSHVLSFQGRLADPDSGKPYADGQYQVTFTIYDAETEGNGLWTEAQDVTVSGGLFSVYLGSVTPFPDDLFAYGGRWLGIQVAGDDEMPQRIRFTPAPWAIHAATAGTDNDWTVSGDDVYRLDGNVGIGTTGPLATLDVARAPDSSADFAIRGYHPDGVGVAGEALSGTGVRGSGSVQGGYFEDSDGSGYAHVGCGQYGIQAHGTTGGGYFRDSDNSSYAYAGHGDYGIEAQGTTEGAGGYFEDTNESGYAWVGGGQYGIKAYGSYMGGYFEDTNESGYARVAYGDCGICAYGTDLGGYFEDTDSSGYCRVGYSSYKLQGIGNVSFVQNHPDDADKVIVYACPEGDEVATYTRGTARLVNGEAIVPLGETFKWVTNPDIGLTAHLTLRGDSPGLYVASLTTEELVVKEVGGGTSSVAFDYIVYGLRIGFEEVSIVQEKEQEAHIPSMADHRALYERRPELRDFNALERFKRMRAAAGEAGDVDLTASQELRDRIVEFDPALHAVDTSVE